MVVFILVVGQPDLGGAIIIASIAGLIFFSLPFGKREKRIVLGIGASGVAIVLFLVFVCEVYAVK